MSMYKIMQFTANAKIHGFHEIRDVGIALVTIYKYLHIYVMTGTVPSWAQHAKCMHLNLNWKSDILQILQQTTVISDMKRYFKSRKLTKSILENIRVSSLAINLAGDRL